MYEYTILVASYPTLALSSLFLRVGEDLILIFLAASVGLFTSPLRPREDRRVPGSSYLTVALAKDALVEVGGACWSGRRRTEIIVES